MSNKTSEYELVDGYVYVNTLAGRVLLSQEFILKIALDVVSETNKKNIRKE